MLNLDDNKGKDSSDLERKGANKKSEQLGESLRKYFSDVNEPLYLEIIKRADFYTYPKSDRIKKDSGDVIYSVDYIH